MLSSLPAAINAALARCNQAGRTQYFLPHDFSIYPVLKVNRAGKCIGIRFWQARIGEHFGRGSTVLWAVRSVCPSNNNSGGNR